MPSVPQRHIMREICSAGHVNSLRASPMPCNQKKEWNGKGLAEGGSMREG